MAVQTFLVNRLNFLKKSLPTVATVSGLLAVGWCGHATHWTFSWSEAEGHVTTADHKPAEEHDTQELIASQSTLTTDGDCQVTFGSEHAVARNGIQTASVTEQHMIDEVRATGVISYDDRLVAQLAPRVSGSIWRVEKHLGEVVHKGDVLAIIESEAVGKAKAEFLDALVALDSDSEIYRSLEMVKDSIPTRQLREAMSELRTTRIRLLNAEQSLVNLGLPVDKADYANLSDDQRSQRIRVLGLPEPLLQGLEQSRLSSNLLPLVAPFEGVVISREAVVGEVVDPGGFVFEIADTSRMWITLEISKEDMNDVRPGQLLHFLPDGLETELESRVAWISTELNEETLTLKVRAQVENPVLTETHRLLRAHTYGTGKITVRENQAARVVPRESIQWDGRNYVIFIQESPTKFSGRRVKLGLQNGQFVEIMDAPPVGTRIAVAGSHLLKSQWQFSRMETASR